MSKKIFDLAEVLVFLLMMVVIILPDSWGVAGDILKWVLLLVGIGVLLAVSYSYWRQEKELWRGFWVVKAGFLLLVCVACVIWSLLG